MEGDLGRIGDDLFPRDDRALDSPKPTEFVAKIIQPLWFMESADCAQSVKNRADYLYHAGEYERALVEFDRCVALCTNNTLRRDAEESRVWCLLKLANPRLDSDRRRFRQHLVETTTTIEQQTPGLFLDVFATRDDDVTADRRESLMRFICAHPHQAWAWIDLARTYGEAGSGGTGGGETSRLAASCLCRALLVARRCAHASCGFAHAHHVRSERLASDALDRIDAVTSEEKSELLKITEACLDEPMDIARFDEQLRADVLLKLADLKLTKNYDDS